MEAHSSSFAMPVAVGGLAGHVFPPGDGRFVGGCVGFVKLNYAERRHVGGCVGNVSLPGDGRFVGGCVGLIPSGAYLAQPGSHPHARAHRELRVTWREGALEGSPA